MTQQEAQNEAARRLKNGAWNAVAVETSEENWTVQEKSYEKGWPEGTPERD